MQDYPKVQGIFTQVKLLCGQLKKNINEAEHDLIRIEFINPKLGINNRQEVSFMYAQLFKEILLVWSDHDGIIAFKTMIAFCRNQYQFNPSELELINAFGSSYNPSQVVWWYTQECFLYKMLNKALRVQTHTIIYTFRSFILHLHTQLKQLATTRKETIVLTLYRDQSLSNVDFEKLKKNHHGLLSFNAFLSISANKNVALNFARQSAEKQSIIGVLL
ncbi:unnamed protein product [Rotaria sp. Silwood2]|nr:unnamed protein product [Rotaria sp. Silwood2]